jgi:hypothetical protein
MSLRYYFDQHMPRAIARGLGRHDVDVLTTQEEGAEEWEDVDVFARAVELGRIMVTEDSDYIAIARAWMAEGRSFPGLVKAKDPWRDIGGAIEDLRIVAACYSEEEMVDRIVYIPL